jgi:hypothetical protein
MRLMRTFQTLLPIAALAGIAACAALDDESSVESEEGIDDAELNLVAIAERPNGNQLRFYEPMPGNILTVELGTARTMPRMNDAIALFQAAEPGAAIPAALAEAADRARQLEPVQAGERQGTVELSVPADQAVDRAPMAAAGPISAAGACDINTFIEDECTNGTFEWCKINWWNGFYAYATTVNTMHNAVCSLTGTVTLRLLINSVPKASYTVVKGAKGAVAWVNLSSNFGFYTEITNASGDMFHVGGAATNF